GAGRGELRVEVLGVQLDQQVTLLHRLVVEDQHLVHLPGDARADADDAALDLGVVGAFLAVTQDPGAERADRGQRGQTGEDLRRAALGERNLRGRRGDDLRHDGRYLSWGVVTRRGVPKSSGGGCGHGWLLLTC